MSSSHFTHDEIEEHFKAHPAPSHHSQYEDKELRKTIKAIKVVDYNSVDDAIVEYPFSDLLDEATLNQLVQLITQKQLEARIDELKELRARHSRTYTQTVTDNLGNKYVSDTHSYISSYETQEQILNLEAELTNQKGN